MELKRIAESVARFDDSQIVKLACLAHLTKKCSEIHVRKTEARKMQRLSWECIAAYVNWEIGTLSRIESACAVLAKAQTTHAYLETLPD